MGERGREEIGVSPYNGEKITEINKLNIYIYILRRKAERKGSDVSDSEAMGNVRFLTLAPWASGAEAAQAACTHSAALYSVDEK